ncbi:MAG: hypothetical protein ACREQA_20690 [Candidatus Binatia bacterium]
MAEFIETPRDLAEALADMLGIQDNPECMENKEGQYGLINHQCILGNNLLCRVLWVSKMAQRITDAVLTEFNLDRAAQEPSSKIWVRPWP